MKYLKTACNRHLMINFVMKKHGWARLDLAIDDDDYCIALSDFLSFNFDPFEHLMYWIDDIAKNNLPAQIDIDEEGYTSSLIVDVYFGDDVNFIMQGFTDNKIYFNIMVNRQEFVKKFRQEFIRFFQQDFDQEHWDNHANLKPIILNHNWYDENDTKK